MNSKIFKIANVRGKKSYVPVVHTHTTISVNTFTNFSKIRDFIMAFIIIKHNYVVNLILGLNFIVENIFQFSSSYSLNI